MNKISDNRHFYISTIFTTIYFLPFLIQGFISSDWDSYAIIGTAFNYFDSKIYTPSRPPGFPLYELSIGLLISFSKKISIEFEKILLIFQYFQLLSLNLIILNFVKKFEKNIFTYYLIIFSPIYIISGLTVIDYFLGSIFGFLALYCIFFRKNTHLTILFSSLLLSFSVSSRLSNLIFILVVLLFLIFDQRNYKNSYLFIFYTTLLTILIYMPFYSDIYSFLGNQGQINNPLDFLCIFNLANTDHGLIDRLARFFLKQINFIGIVGFIILLINVKKLKINLKNKNIYLFLTFLFFELSFLRLPTEEGHLLPAFIALFLLIDFKNVNLLKIVLFFVILTSFLNIKFYEVDIIDGASTGKLTLSIESGLLIQDYEIRGEKGLEKDFHYKNAQNSLLETWKNGCPN